MRLPGVLIAYAAASAFAAASARAEPKLMDWPDLLGRPAPKATVRVAYGPDPLQVAELWRPEGKGPFPTVLMIHGGCWRSGTASLHVMDYAADDLRQRGFAVWNIEYRGVDRPGGGYPGTFQDVAAAADNLEALAPQYHLQLDRLVALGHSAGGHLAFWLAGRTGLPAASPLRGPSPLRVHGVVSLGGLPDLKAVEALGDQSCGRETVHRLIGASGPAHPDPYADTSPAELGHGRAPGVQINGEEDTIAPPAMADAYVARMTARGENVRQITLPDTGHVELIAPGTAAWAEAVKAVESLSGR